MRARGLGGGAFPFVVFAPCFHFGDACITLTFSAIVSGVVAFCFLFAMAYFRRVLLRTFEAIKISRRSSVQNKPRLGISAHCNATR